MPIATWNGVTLAESDRCEVVEGNQYFPPDAINRAYFKESSTHTTCSWKGLASYYNVEVDGKVNKDAAWYYPTPKEAAKNITGYVAFWRGVKSDRISIGSIVVYFVDQRPQSVPVAPGAHSSPHSPPSNKWCVALAVRQGLR